MDLELITIEGGKAYFYETGIYLSELYFHSKKLSASWTIRMTHDTHIGNLKMNGKVVFNFKYHKRTCKVQEVIEGQAREWVEIKVEGRLCD